MSITRTTALSGLVLVFALGLSACSSAEAAPDPSPTPSAAEPSPTPSASAAAEEEPDDVLFTVSAKVRAIDGTTLDIRMAGHTPIESTERRGAALADDFIEQCAALDGKSISNAGVPVSVESLTAFGSGLMKLEVSSEPEGYTFVAPVDLILGSPNVARVASGDSIVMVESNDRCLGRYQMTETGVGTGIANYESGTERPDLAQWSYGHYGFTVPYESGASIEACVVEITELGEDVVADIPGWEPGSDSTGISCGIGYRGE